jgi:cell division protein FtsQ
METEGKIYEPVVWPYRLLGNAIIIALIWLLTFAVITVRHNLVGQQIDSLLSEIYEQTASVGWGLDDVTLEGRNKTTLAEVLQAIDVKRGDNILQIDLAELKNKINMLPWVKNVSISRHYFPNVLHIYIQEKKVRSIWQYKNEFYPIDEDGEVIAAEYVPPQGVLQIIGEDAPLHINKLLRIIEKDKELFLRLKAANFISKRRWDLIFDDVENGIMVKMPEKDVEEAWHKLVKLDKTKGILKRKLTFIDLRLKNKVIVKIKNN